MATTDQGAYAAVCRPRSICSCMQIMEPMRLYADQGAYALYADHACKEHMQLYAGQVILNCMNHEMPMCFVHICFDLQ